MTTTTMTQALDQSAANLRARLARAARAAGFVAAAFLFTMSGTEHMSRAATSPQRSSETAAPSRTTDAPKVPVGQKSVAQTTREDYQQREANSQDLANFAGGSAGIYIGGSTAAVILLIVLLVILL
jgi:hypothetical protein